MPALKAELVELVKNLEVGDVVKGRVLEAIDGMVTLKTSSGQQLTAALLTDIEIAKGSVIELVISGMDGGKLLAQLKEQGTLALNLEAKLGELLAKMNIPVNDKTLEAAKLLIKHNMPLDKEHMSSVVNLEKNAVSLAKTSTDGAVGIVLSGVDIEAVPLDLLNKVVLSTEKAVSQKLQEIVKEQSAPGVLHTEEEVAEKQVNIKPSIVDSAAEAQKHKSALENNIAKGAINTEDQVPVKDLGEKLHQLMKQLDIDTDSNPEVKNLISTLVKAVQTAGKVSNEAIVYLLSKDLEPSAKNLNLLENNINNKEKLSTFLAKLEDQINTHSHKELKEVKEEMKKVFLQPSQLGDKEEVQEKLKEVIKLGEKLEAILGQKEIKDMEIKSTLTSLRDNISFIKSINEHNNYLQIPIMINGRNTSAEVYVFKDGKRGKAIDPNHATVLLSLDLKYLGHLESMINIDQKSVNVTFRLEDNKIGDLLKSRSEQLRLSLEARGYRLNTIKVIKLEQAFNLITLEELINQGTKERVHLDVKI